MKQNWLLLIFFFTLPLFSTAKHKTIQCETFKIQRDAQINGTWDLNETVVEMQEKKEYTDCELHDCAMYMCYNYKAKTYFYGSMCLDTPVWEVCGRSDTLYTFRGHTCVGSNNVLAKLCWKTSCLNGFNKCVEEWKQYHDTIGDLAWNDIRLIPNSYPEVSIFNTSKETNDPPEPVIIATSSSPKSNEDEWKTECIEGKCKEAEEDGNLGLKNHYSFITFLGLIFIKYLFIAVI